METGEALKRFRGEFGLQQKDIAAALGIKPQAYQVYEAGKVTPSVEVVKRIAVAFDVSMDYLVGLSDKPRPPEYDEREVKEAFALRDALKNVMRDSVILAK